MVQQLEFEEMPVTEAMIHLVNGVQESPWNITLTAQVCYDKDEKVLPDNVELNAIYQGVIHAGTGNMGFYFLHTWQFSIRGVELTIGRRQYNNGGWGDFYCPISPTINIGRGLLII